MRAFYRGMAVAGEMQDGSSVLDIPYGGGVAFRTLRPEQSLR